MPTRLRSKNGLTLLEVLVAMTLMYVAVWGILTVLMTTNVSLSSSRNTELATQIAQEEIEGWLQQGYAGVTALPSSQPGTVTITSQASGTTQSTPFAWTLTHTPIIVGNIEQVQAQVTWVQKVGTGTINKSVILTGSVMQ